MYKRDELQKGQQSTVLSGNWQTEFMLSFALLVENNSKLSLSVDVLLIIQASLDSTETLVKFLFNPQKDLFLIKSFL